MASNVSLNYLSCSCLKALSVVGEDIPMISAETSRSPQPLTPLTPAQQRYSGRLHRTALRNATAYASCQINPRTPITTPSCSSESPSNCHVPTLLGSPQQQLRKSIPKIKIYLINRPTAFNTGKTNPMLIMKKNPCLSCSFQPTLRTIKTSPQTVGRERTPSQHLPLTP